MSEPGSRRGRVHDAEGAREAILDAAEEVFAQHGFDGARIDAIAATAGYNKSLIFQYFGDKLNLYAEVIRRADRYGTEMQMQLFASLFEGSAEIPSDVHKFRELIERAMRVLFDYLHKYPRILRIILWEQAEGWDTWTKIFDRLDTTDDLALFKKLFAQAQGAGLLRPDADPLLLILLAEQMYMSYLTSAPLYRSILPVEQVASSETLLRVQEYIIEFIVHGLLAPGPANGLEKEE